MAQFDWYVLNLITGEMRTKRWSYLNPIQPLTPEEVEVYSPVDTIPKYTLFNNANGCWDIFSKQWSASDIKKQCSIKIPLHILNRTILHQVKLKLSNS